MNADSLDNVGVSCRELAIPREAIIPLVQVLGQCLVTGCSHFLAIVSTLMARGRHRVLLDSNRFPSVILSEVTPQ
jgi:hypothetical protein